MVVVGLGSGETAWAVGCRGETRSLRVYEIAAAQPRLLRAVSTVAPFAGLVELLSDPRLVVVAADGRQALAREERRYDIVQVDAMFRTSAGSGNLYSLEFFRLCASRLKPGGIVCTQKPSRRVGLTFAEALPHALDLGNIVVGSNEPLPIDLAGLGGAAAAAGGGGPLRPGDAPGDPGPAPRGGPRPPQPRGPRGPQPRPVSARRVRDAGGLVEPARAT